MKKKNDDDDDEETTKKKREKCVQTGSDYKDTKGGIIKKITGGEGFFALIISAAAHRKPNFGSYTVRMVPVPFLSIS